MTEFVGVVEQVSDHLRQARGVTVHEDRSSGQVELQVKTASLDCPAIVLAGLGDDADQIASFRPQQDFSVCQARRVQQIIDEPAHMAHLTFQSFRNRRTAGVAWRHDLLQLQAIVNWTQRVAQFVRQHPQELILAPVGLSNLFHEHNVLERRRCPCQQVRRQRITRGGFAGRQESDDPLGSPLNDKGEKMREFCLEQGENTWLAVASDAGDGSIDLKIDECGRRLAILRHRPGSLLNTLSLAKMDGGAMCEIRHGQSGQGCGEVLSCLYARQRGTGARQEG